MKRLLMTVIVLAGVAVSTSAQMHDTVRIMSYNLLRFSDNSSDRIPLFRSILNEARPRVVLLQEIANSEGGNLFVDSVLGQLDIPLQGGHLFVPADSVQDSYVGIWVDTMTFRIIRYDIIDDYPRDQGALIVEHKGSHSVVALMTAHNKAGDTQADESQRNRNANVTRQYASFPTGCLECVRDSASIIFGGVLNTYSGDAFSYFSLTVQIGGDRPFTGFIDPVGVAGATFPFRWHDNPDASLFHTQSTRMRQFGEGTSGGLTDRFDLILTSLKFKEIALVDYSVFGNDGQHFNDSINAGVNGVVSPQIAQALHDASDHLPVVLSVVFLNPLGAVEEKERHSIEIDLTQATTE